MFLHPADEIPMVRDLGFAVPPGRHSLIAVKASVVSDRKIIICSYEARLYPELFFPQNGFVV